MRGGALLCIVKEERKPRPEDIDYMPEIKTPHALPSMRTNTTSKKKQTERIRNDPLMSRKPEIPL